MIENIIRNIRLMMQKELQPDVTLENSKSPQKEKRMAKIVTLDEQSDFPIEKE